MNTNTENQPEDVKPDSEANAVGCSDLLACPFCKMPDECKSDSKPRTTFLGNVVDHKGEMFILGYAVRCGWCGAQGPNAGIPVDAEDYWNERRNHPIAPQPSTHPLAQKGTLI